MISLRRQGLHILKTLVIFVILFFINNINRCVMAQMLTDKQPEFTPYKINPFSLNNETEAINALNSTDIMMRRAAVVWYGYSIETGGIGTNNTHLSLLRNKPELITVLSKAVQEMPERDAVTAAQILALLGSKAESSIPVICDAMFRWDGIDFVLSANLLNSLIYICGGVDKVTPTLISFLLDKHFKNRLAIVRGLGYVVDATFSHLYPPPNGARSMTLAEATKWRTNFQEFAIPALAEAVDDHSVNVRIAAAESLERITRCIEEDVPYQTMSYWEITVKPLMRMASSHNAQMRLAALKTLAFEPCDVSQAAPTLKENIHGNKEESEYALDVLCHAVQLNPEKVLSVFLADIRSQDTLRRRIATKDISLATTILWNGYRGENQPGRWVNDSRLFGYSSNIGLKPKQSRCINGISDTQEKLLNVLLIALSDADYDVRENATIAFESIGKSVCTAHCALPIIRLNGKVLTDDKNAVSIVTSTLTKGAEALKRTDPVLAKRLIDVERSFHSPII